LRRLQAGDEQVGALRSDIAAIEAVQRGDAELDRRRVSAATASAARRDADAQAAAVESELETLQKRVRSLDRRLYDGSVHNPQELLEMQRALETMRERAAAVEGHAFELLEAAEAAGADERSATLEVSVRESRRAEEMGPLQQRRTARLGELELAASAREAAAAAVDPGDLRLYDRVSSRRTPAVVRLDGDSCGGCRLPLSIDERHAVRTGADIVQCPNCDRILVP
jgi:predicted  nucleic acid-binding Zn-ribbon protein